MELTEPELQVVVDHRLRCLRLAAAPVETPVKLKEWKALREAIEYELDRLDVLFGAYKTR